MVERMVKIKNHLGLLNRLNQFAACYPATQTVKELALYVEQVLDDLFEIEYSGLYLYDFQEERLKLLFAKGFNKDEQRDAEKTAMERRPGYVFKTGETLNIPDTENDREQHILSSEMGIIVRSMLYMPVMNGNEAVGSFGIVSSRKNNFPDESVAMLSFICNMAGSIYGKILIQDELKKASLIAQETDNAIVITNRKGITEWVNPSFERITGYTLEDLKGSTPEELLYGPETDPETLQEICEAKQKKIPIEVELLTHHKSGKPLWIRTQVQPVFDGQGELSRYICIQRDITEQKKSKDDMESLTTRLSALITNMHSGILVEDQHRNIALINQSFCTLFNIPVDPAVLVGTDCSNSAEQSKHLFQQPEQFISRIEHILEDKKNVIGEELELVDGQVYERDYIPIFINERFFGNLWQYRDITSRKKIENDLRQATAEAESANSSKSLFLAKMSHEIRTPLNAIIGLSKLMRETALNAEQKLLNKKLIISGENLLEIINDILDFSKIEAGHIELESIPFNIKELINKVYILQEHISEEKRIALTTRVNPLIPDMVIGDPVRLQQVLVNLVNNAIKFTQQGGVEISCEFIGSTEGKATLSFAVSDTGIGISEENQKTIFERFKQEDESVTRSYGGTGLGLAISQQLTNLMGGNINVDSKKGMGSRFYFTLELPVSNLGFIPPEESGIAYDPHALDNYKILVVEDNEFNQFIVKAILERWGGDVDIAENGQVAVTKLSLSDFHLVLMDLQMPVMDGYTATRIIRKEMNKNIPVIALTANVTKEAIEKVFEAGMDAYISKPFEEEELYIKVTGAIRKPASEPGIPVAGNKTVTVKQPKEEQLYDLGYLFNILGGNKDQVMEMLVEFMQYIPEYYQDLLVAFEKKETREISKRAHKIKSSVDLLASQSIKDIFRLILENCRKNNHPDTLEDQFHELTTLFPLFLEQINKLIRDYKTT